MAFFVNFVFSVLFFFCFSSLTAPQVERKKTTGVQMVTASQVQSTGCRWQAIRKQTLTKRKAMGI